MLSEFVLEMKIVYLKECRLLIENIEQSLIKSFSFQKVRYLVEAITRAEDKDLWRETPLTESKKPAD